MAKYVCSVCGYVHEGDAAPASCPLCKVGPEKFNKQEEGELEWAAEHVLGVAQGSPEDVMEALRANFEGECTEVGMYLAMARVAHRKDIQKLDYTGKKQHLKKQNTQVNSQNY